MPTTKFTQMSRQAVLLPDNIVANWWCHELQVSKVTPQWLGAPAERTKWIGQFRNSLRLNVLKVTIYWAGSLCNCLVWRLMVLVQLFWRVDKQKIWVTTIIMWLQHSVYAFEMSFMRNFLYKSREHPILKFTNIFLK